MIFLSPSLLNLFQECPRCFWLRVNKRQKRPEGPSSTLPRALDLAIKKHFDIYRPELPPGVSVDGLKLFGDLETLRKWRYWKTAPFYLNEKIGVKLSGALDDCFLDSNGMFSPLDYKTYGFVLKAGAHPSYQLQMDSYTLMLRESRYPVNNKAYLVFYALKSLGDNGNVAFQIVPRPVDTNPDRIISLLEKAVEVLKKDIPPHSQNCTFCGWNRGGEINQ